MVDQNDLDEIVQAGSIPEEHEEMVFRRIGTLREETTLSDREAQAVACKTVGMTAKETAAAMGVAVGTINEYLDRAKDKARDGFETYDALRFYGVVDPVE